MTRQNLPHIALAAAALVLGAALLPASASAQVRNPNDGGPVAVAPGATLDGGSKAAPTQTYYGRNANDGGDRSCAGAGERRDAKAEQEAGCARAGASRPRRE